MKRVLRSIALVLVAGLVLAPAAYAQRGGAGVGTRAPHPTVVTPPVLVSPRLDAPSLVPRVVTPSVQASVLVVPPPAVAPGLGDGGGADDLDGDGHAQGADCNDRDAAIHPGAAELWNGLDDNCDGVIY